MKFTVISTFVDKNTKNFYSVGNVYESDDSDRIAYLVDKGFLEGDKEITPSKPDGNNDEEIDKYHIGGGYYQFPNGEKVRGKENAIEVLEKIKAGE